MELAGEGSRRIGRYDLSEPIGGGPTGEVFRAKIHGVAGLDRQFAVKRIHRAILADPSQVAALQSALRLYASLEHPRIAQLYEYRLDGPQPFIAIEWCAGLDLARLIDATFGQGRPLSTGAATSLLSRAARAVGHAHGRGLVHQGLSPTNVICSPRGEVKVTDFGLIASRLGPSPADDPTLLNRLTYLAPEQFAGESCSPATDVFSLGALFYELIGGNRAFSGRGGHDIAAAIQTTTPDMATIPKPLARVLSRCMASSPYERYPSGGALADAIDAAARGMLMRGDQSDAAKAVQEAGERLETRHRQQASGALSFPFPAPPQENAVAVKQTSTTDGAKFIEPKTNVVAKSPAHTIMAAAPPPAQRVDFSPTNPSSARASPASSASDLFDDSAPTIDFSRSGKIGKAVLGAVPYPTVEPELPRPPLDQDLAPPVIGDGRVNGPQQPASRRRQMVLGAGAGLLGLGMVAYLLSGDSSEEDDHSQEATVVVLVTDASILSNDSSGGGAGSQDPPASGPVTSTPPSATIIIDAGARAPTIPTVHAEGDSTNLVIRTTPSRATIYINGAMIGKSPLTFDSSGDQHKVVAIRAGYKMFMAETKGERELNVTLEEVTPTGGPAGIKVRCRKKNRYVVFVDDKDVGQRCPTERIGIEMGQHTVEIYDPVTDARRRFEVDVTQTRLSSRVRVD